MANKERDLSVNSRRALVFTSLMGVVLAAIALVSEQYGETDLTKMLWTIALIGVMVGGVAMAYFLNSDNN